MNNRKLLLTGLLNAAGVFGYTAAVSWLLFNGGKLFGNSPSFWIPLAILLLFVLSATIVGLLVLGRPAYLCPVRNTPPLCGVGGFSYFRGDANTPWKFLTGFISMAPNGKGLFFLFI